MTKEERKEQVLQELKQLVAEIIGEDVIEELDITKESIFSKDLEMDSIEIVNFAEKVKNKYSEVDFIKWLSNKEFTELLNLSFEDIINFVVDADSSDK